ncbi:transporter [Brachybacterium phenoliresistens]|uniref:Transporter n=1 Tax=Brachybacterium phenoliresistens TaxID=396014 RepID=Z9JU10_9MICO|nr:cation diffusion facilitator family transporter [Brachybacterium phenoliresistens]EWS81498.1 transporter [Brachybacterium phenoliresistens]
MSTQRSTAQPAERSAAGPADLTRFAWLSIATAIATIALKAGAWAMTGSVGLLSDAAESTVNLVAAVVALIALKVAAQGATQRYLYGRAKAEYFSAAVEGAMIFVAAGVILVTAVERFVHPQELENVGWGLLVSVIASVLNGAVAFVLIRAGRRYRSITLRADGRHLLTDVWTSVGVLVGVGLVALTGWERLDAVVAFAVGVNIIVTGVGLVSESVAGLLDKALSDEDNAVITAILRQRVAAAAAEEAAAGHAGETGHGVAFHGLQTRDAGQEKFMNVHVLVPDDWSVKRGHDYIEDLEAELAAALPGLRVLTHLEPISDPASYEDIPAAHIPIHGDHRDTDAPPSPAG